ncbi:MAG TPA: MOSC N-terminal beta barrel domain-containing protein [Pyrinomonadaceae bacterium]|nr:MOSC N-terminal beta barrel domain-containing protein [Pyrinomonadaceae bacterium]
MIVGRVQQIWRHAVKSMAGEKLEACEVGSKGIPGDRGWAVRDETSGEITNGKRIPLLMQCSARYRNAAAFDVNTDADIVLADGTVTATDDAEVNSHLSRLFGKPVRLWPLQPASNKEFYRRAGTSARIAGRLTRFSSFRSLLPTLTSFGPMNRQMREMFSREADEPIPDLSQMPQEVLEFTSPLGTYFDAFPINLLTTASLKQMAKLNPSAIWDVRRFRPNFVVETGNQLEGLVEAGWAGRVLKLGEVELKLEIPCARCGMTMHAQKDLPKDPSVLRSIVKEANQNMGIYASVISDGTVRVGDKVELTG